MAKSIDLAADSIPAAFVAVQLNTGRMRLRRASPAGRLVRNIDDLAIPGPLSDFSSLSQQPFGFADHPRIRVETLIDG